MTNKTKAVAFLRVSSNRQKDNTSHETQESEMLKYASENALDIVQIFRLTESAKNSAARVKYREGLGWARKNKVRHVLFYIFDRETRNLTDNEENENLVRAGDMVIHYVKEHKIYHAQSSDSDFFLRDVQAVTNKHYIRQHRTKVIDAMRTKAESGHYPGNHPPLGYVNVRIKDTRRGTVIIKDPDAKKLRQVQREFALRAEGFSCDQIRECIIQEGFISPLKTSNYSRSGIEKRLRNSFYYGKFIWQEKEYDGKHELIIGKRVLDLVAKSFRHGNYQRKQVGEHGVFAGGWLKCADQKCGCNIVYDPKTKAIVKTGAPKIFHYYRCTNGRRVHKSIRHANESKLWAQFEGALDAITIDDVLAEEISARLNQSFASLRRERKAEIDRYRGLLTSLEAREDEAYADRKSGVLDESMYARQIAKIREERKRYTDALELASDHLDDVALETAQSTIELAKEAKTLWLSRSAQERVEFLNLILSNRVLDGITVRYELRKPWSTLKEIKEKSDWWPLVDRFLTECRSAAA